MLDNLRSLATEFVHRFYHRPRRLRAFLAHQQPFIHITPDGLKFNLVPGEIVDQYIATEGIYERRFLRFFRETLPPGAVMIDIGANIGNHALYLRNICSAIHCFEPNPTAAKRLHQNVALNEAHNIHVHEIGLGDRNAMLPFASNVVGNLGNSGFLEGQEHQAGSFEKIDLPIVRADEAIADLALSRLDFIKIDVEGLEEQIFKGLDATITRFRPLIAFEFHGQLTPHSTFDNIRACLPDYRIADMDFAAEDSGTLGRIGYHLRHGTRLTLRDVIRPSARTYESLLAVPLEHALARTIVD